MGSGHKKLHFIAGLVRGMSGASCSKIMKTMQLKGTTLTVPRIALGCMRISGLENAQASKLINTAMEAGVNFFDHADIYGGGESERVFSKAVSMSPSVREKMILQSKCGIRKGFFDFSKEYILSSVDGILERLNTEYLDILLLHRPDTLVEPSEVAEAFDILQKSGKVRYFGVSNENPMQIELLQKSVSQRLIINQLQFSITNTTMIKTGLNVNMENEAAVNRDGSVLDYCRLKDITIQPWSPFQYGFFEGVFLDNDKFPELNAKINEIAARYEVTNSAVAIAWILRHPANMQPIAGTTNPKRFADICKAGDFDITREEWYEIFRAAGNILP